MFTFSCGLLYLLNLGVLTGLPVQSAIHKFGRARDISKKIFSSKINFFTLKAVDLQWVFFLTIEFQDKQKF